MADTRHVDDLLIEIETRFQRTKNDLAKLDQTNPSKRIDFQNDIQTQFDLIQSKINELRAGCRSLPANNQEFYQSEAKNFTSTYKQLLSDFSNKKIIPINEPAIGPLSPTEENAQKAEEVVQKLDDTIKVSVDAVSKKLDTEIKKIENRLQHVKTDLDRLDQCLPSQRTNFQIEIQKQIDVIQSKINKISNSSRSLTPKESVYYDNKIQELRSQCQQLISDLRDKETPSNGISIIPASEVPIERSVNIESINDFIDQNEEIPEKKCFNPCLNNYIIWITVIILAGVLGFSLYWKLK